MNPPLFLINFKSYQNATGEKAVFLAKLCEEVGIQTGKSIAIAVHPFDLQRICLLGLKILVFAQHVDPVEVGASTGSLPPTLVKSLGVTGTLLNHSEKPLSFEVLKASIAMAKEAGLVVVVCVDSKEEALKIQPFSPDFIAFEPSHLIGGTVSVSESAPEKISRIAQSISPIPLLAGAGIHSGKDVEKALTLGAQGVLVASAIVEAKDQRAVLLEIVG